MESSESIGDVDDNEIQKTFLFYFNECLPWTFNLFCLFIYMGGFFFHGVDVVVGTASQFNWLAYFIHIVEYLYAKE
ncbi:hypothetical protein [Halobacillus mangrovi]|uniref:hypothetical protein n=1 Tax=Halobacillus mangrovi TaxID=402384 RepID=UPI003D99BED4